MLHNLLEFSLKPRPFAKGLLAWLPLPGECSADSVCSVIGSLLWQTEWQGVCDLPDLSPRADDFPCWWKLRWSQPWPGILGHWHCAVCWPSREVRDHQHGSYVDTHSFAFPNTGVGKNRLTVVRQIHTVKPRFSNVSHVEQLISPLSCPWKKCLCCRTELGFSIWEPFHADTAAWQKASFRQQTVERMLLLLVKSMSSTILTQRSHQECWCC